MKKLSPSPPDPRVLLNDVLLLIERDVKRISRKKKPDEETSLILSRYANVLRAVSESREEEDATRARSLKTLSTEELRARAAEILKLG